MNMGILALTGVLLSGGAAVDVAEADAAPVLHAAIVEQGQGKGQGKDQTKADEPSARQQKGQDQAGRQEERGGKGKGRQSKPEQARPQKEQPRSERSESRPKGAAPDRPQPSRGSGAAAGDRSDSRTGGNAALERRGGGPTDRSSPARGGTVRGRLSPAEVRAQLATLPPGIRNLAASRRANERMVAGAIARGRARGQDPDALDIRSRDGRVTVRNRDGALLLDMDEARARDLGAWRMRLLGDRRPTGNAPAFCRSGEGHPVWGREWCLDKGFGLGSDPGRLWSRTRVDDGIYRRSTDRGGLLGVLGDVVFGRLAFHALSLGLTDPLAGTWVEDPRGPRILRVRAGDDNVAEFVDLDRDDRMDVLYVVQPL